MSKSMYDLTNPQKSIWYTEQFYKRTSIENIPAKVTIFEKVNFKKLEMAINLFVEKNDSFRLKFIIENNEVKQYLEDYSFFSLKKISVSSEKDVKKIEDELSNTPFNILNSFLFKFVLFEFTDGHGGFIISMHHLISDAWTSGIVASEVINIYDLLLNNQPVSKEKAPSYLDYISSETDYLSSEKYEKDKVFWNNLFSNIPEVATIPSTNNTSVSCKAKRKQFIINIKLMNLIGEFCKSHKVSEFNFFMGIISIYLGRVSSLDEFVIGTPVLNRSNFKEKHTTGMFISVVPFKVTLNNNSTFAEFISEISKNFFNIFRHQKYSYQTLLEDLRKKYGNNLLNLFKVMLSYQNMRSNKQTANINYESKWIFNNNISDDLDIHFYDVNDTGNIIMAYDYRTEMYSIDDIYSIHERILNIINQVLQNDKILLKDIEIVTPDEKRKILNKFNDTKANYPKDKTIIQLFEEQVEKTPDNIAVKIDDDEITYKELNKKSNQLAHYLLNKGVSVNEVIAIRTDKRIEMIVAILGIIKAGACYLPINLAYPKERVEFMISDSKAKLLLCDSKTKDDINIDIEHVIIDFTNDSIYSCKDSNPHLLTTPDDLLYIIYTSGSTGTPKGAMITNKNVVRLMKNDKFLFNFSEKDVWTMFHSVAFDFSVWEMYGALLYGAKLLLVPDSVAKDPVLFLNLLRREKVTVLNQTPTYFYNLLNSELQYDDSDLKLRYVIYGGEALNPSAIIRWKEKYPDTKLINMYGITETTVHVTFKELLLDNLKLNNSNIGKPIPTLKVLLLDKNLKLVPIGVPGEICVVGDGVFNGYLNRPDLNETKLIPNPYNNSEILYRSGDSAFLNQNYELEYVGRIDTQVKIRGFRVELGEIEERILESSNIESCVVTTKSVGNSHDLLCAYYIKSAPVNISSLRTLLEKKLPKYMIPQYFIELTSFPYNHNGKIDKKALPIPEVSTDKEIVLPRNLVDEQLINIFKNMLNVTSISITDSFFDLGGDSLMAINLCTKIYSKFNVQIFVKDILENPIIKDLSDLILSKNYEINENIISTVDKLEYYPVSSAQKRMYYASSIAGDNSNLYNITGGLILSKVPDIKKLESAFNKLINKQPSLRTYFEIENKQVVQKIRDTVEFSLETSSNIIKDNEIKSFFKDFVKPFDLSKAPLFRAKIVKMEDEKAMLAIDMHHIISDGISLSVLINNICKMYNNEEIPDLKIDYKDYSVWENNKLNNGEFRKAEDYWVNQFKNEIPVLNLPTKPRPAVQSFEGDKIYTKINKTNTEKICNLAKDLGVTPYMLLLSAYYILLYKYTSQDDIVVGTPIVNRNSNKLYDVIGMFVNSLPLKANINSNLNFKDFLNNIKYICLESYKYQNYPFDELVNKLSITRDPSRNPLFDTMFIYQNNGYAPVSFAGIDAKYYIPNAKISKFDLSLEIVPTDGILNLSFEFATNLFDKDFITKLSNHYINIVNAILKNQEIKIADINMLSEEEKNKILYEFNNTDEDYPKNKTIVQLFEEQVKKTPDNVAVVFGNNHLTYRELNEKANSLAYYLKNEGIKKGEIIPVIMDRSINLIVSMLGIIKLGAIYLPIATEYPIERINYIIKNTSASLIISCKSSEIFGNNIKNIDLNKINYKDFPNSNLNVSIDVNNPLYAIYTSGSTGNPKGVKISHKNLNNFISSFNKLFETSTTVERCLASTNISFDVSIWEIFFTLLNGYELYLFEDNTITDIFKYCNSIISNKISIMYIPPNILDDVFKILNQNAKEICLNKLLVGVEPIKSKTIEKYYLLNPNMKIINGYGPSECTICATACPVTKDILYKFSIVPIGKPLSNLKLYILDKDKNPVPFGVYGELYVCGDNVSSGYINNDEITMKNFIQLPFTSQKAYKTGDIVKLDESGNLLFQGRQDNQVKLNGHRIELDEITNTIYSYPYITKCVIFVHDKKLICYFTSERKVNINDLLSYLQRKLPRYFIPNYLIQLDKFKLTSNGKIDIAYLKNLKIETTNKYVAPKTPIQKELKRIFETVLGSSNIGINDDFFENGGDSLSAIKLQIEAFNSGINISYKDIFSYPTIAQLSEKTGVEKIHEYEDNYDYSKINKLISINTANNIVLSKKHVDNILLTGSTGFMGSHILENLIRNTNCNIYCIIRKKNNIDPANRLVDTMNFYFNNNFERYLYNRVFVLEGDITRPNMGLDSNSYNDLGYSVSCVINAAAIVKHYGKSKIFNDTNVIGTQNIITFCNKFKCSLYHLSTLSVSGTLLNSNLKDTSNKLNSPTFIETNLFINQDLSNIYVRSKFLAERLILENILENNLNAKILRLGNITNRYSDGNFQINISENAFINKVSAFLNIGKFPSNLLDEYIEFTPVDLCADAIVKIIFCKNDFNIFHIHNNNYMSFKKLILTLNKLGFKTEIISPEEFYALVKNISSDKNKSNIISGIINDFNKYKLISYKNNIKISSPLTDNMLKKISFKWPIIDIEYIQKYVTFLKSIGYINK